MLSAEQQEVLVEAINQVAMGINQFFQLNEYFFEWIISDFCAKEHFLFVCWERGSTLSFSLSHFCFHAFTFTLSCSCFHFHTSLSYFHFYTSPFTLSLLHFRFHTFTFTLPLSCFHFHTFPFILSFSNEYLKVGERTWWNGATRQGDQWVWRFSDEPVSFDCLQIQIEIQIQSQIQIEIQSQIQIEIQLQFK